MMLPLYSLSLMALLMILNAANFAVFLPAFLRLAFIVCTRRRRPAMRNLCLSPSLRRELWVLLLGVIRSKSSLQLHLTQ